MADGIAKSKDSGEAAGAERRRKHRYPFVAQAEMTEAGTGKRVSGQTVELSSTGCYMGTPSPFAEGTRVRLRLTRDGRAFEAGATVLRVHAEFGMGVAFEELSAGQQAIVDGWLDETDN